MGLLAEYCIGQTNQGNPIRRLEEVKVKVTARDVEKLRQEVADYFENWLDRTGRRQRYEQLLKRYEKALEIAPYPYGNWFGCLGGKTEVSFSADEIRNELFDAHWRRPDKDQRELINAFDFLANAEASQRRTRRIPKVLIQAARFLDGVLEDIEWSLCPGFAL
jgi:tetratricopeptide (TPR) repeat protein